MVYRFKHLVVALSAALLMAFVFASCAPIADASVSAGSTAVNSSSGAEAEISINLPQIAARSNSLRSMTPEETDDARTQTASFRVTFSCNYKTVTREAVGVDTVSASFYVGTDVSVMVECLNSSGEVIVRTEPKTVKIRSSENNVTFKLSEDGTRIYPENPEPEPPAVKYTVSYTLDGGDWSPNGTPPTAAEYSAGDTVTITTNEPTKQSNNFIGWKATPATVVPVDGNFFQRGGSFTMPASNVTLTAQWTTLQTYTVTFEKGSIPADVTINNWKDSENVIDGDSITLPTLSANGYTFGGWIPVAGTSALQGGTPYTPTTNVTLTAQWTVTDYTITYAENGGQITQPGTNSFTINDTNISFRTVTRQGYTFVNCVYADDQNTPAATTAAALIAKAGSSTNISLMAQWEEMDTLYVNKTGNDDNNDGSENSPFATLNKAFSVANGFNRNDVTIYVQSNLLNQDPGSLNGGKTYTLEAHDYQVSVSFFSGITVSDRTTLKIKDIELLGSGGLTCVVDIQGGDVSLTRAYISHTGNDATSPNTENNSAVRYGSGNLSMGSGSYISKIYITGEALEIEIPEELSQPANGKNMVIYLKDSVENDYANWEILTGDAVDPSYQYFTPSRYTLSSDGRLQ